MSDLNLINMKNVYWDDNSKKIGGEYSSHLVGRLDGKYRLERYLFTPEEPVVTINFDLSAIYSSSLGIYRNFTYSQGADLRNKGIGVYISEVEDMSDWGEFSPANIHSERGAWLSFESNFTRLKGSLTLKTPLEKNKTYYIFFYSQNLDSSNWGAIWWSNGGGPTNNSTYISYTAPGAPSQFWFFKLTSNNKILNSGFTLSWEAAENGSNNEVTGYELQFSWTSTTITLDSTILEYTVQNNNFYTSGQEIEVSIRTIGEVENAKYSDWIRIKGQVNNLPSAPTITTPDAKGIFPTGGKIKFEIDYKDKDSDNDPVSCYYQYRNSLSDTWSDGIQITNSSLEMVLRNKTYFQFYCSDGYEPGQVSAFIVEVYDLEVDPEVKLSCENSSGQQSITKIQFNFDKGSNKIAPFVLLGLRFDEELIFSWSEIISTTNSFILDLIEKKIEIKPEAETYSLEIYPLDELKKSFKDSEGNSIVMYQLNNGLFFSTPTKTEIEVFDVWGNDENIYNSPAYPCFFKNIRLKIPSFDPQIFEYDNYLQFGEEKYKLTAKSNIIDSSWYFETTLSIAKAITQKELTVLLSRGPGFTYKIDLDKYNQIPEFSFDNLKIESWSNIDPIYDQTSLKFSHAFSEVTKKSYAFSDISNKNLSFSLIYNSKRTTVDCSPVFNESESTVTYSCSISKDVVESLEIFSRDYQGQKTFTGEVSLQNKYGHQSIGTFQLIGNFDKLSELSLESLKIKVDNAESYSEIDPNSFKFLEGMPLQINYTTTWWSFDENISLQVVAEHHREDVLLRRVILQNQTIEINNGYNGETTTAQLEFHIPEILEDGYWKLYLQATSKRKLGGKSNFKQYDVKPVSKPEQFKLNKIDYLTDNEEQGQYELDYIYSSNYPGNIYLNWGDNTNKKLVENNTVLFQKSEDPLSNKDSLVMFISAEEEISNSGYTLTKIWVSNTLVVYNLVPTVAYRKNRLIINSKNGEDDSVIYVSRASGAYMVRFKLQDEFGNSRGDLTIDLHSGTIDNAIISGGSWDNAPGGVIPTPDLPTGLAAIAYSGDISDLEQTKDITIVFTGGGSEEI